jgi:hypothetical protein
MCHTLAVGKLLLFKPSRSGPKLRIPYKAAACLKCQHKMDIHISHPEGVWACGARGCLCYIHSWNK